MTPARPPRLAEWLLRHGLPPGAPGDTIRGDLLEELRTSRDSPAARRWYWRQTFSLASRYGWRRLLNGHRRRDNNNRGKGTAMFFDNLRQDLRDALRAYTRAPCFTFVILSTLALGVGAATAIFSMVNGILLRPLPYQDPDRLVHVTETTPKGDVSSVSWPNYLDWRAGSHSFVNLAASRNAMFTLTGTDRAERLPGRRVTANFFRTLGVTPQLGRDFIDGDDRPGAEPVAIVADSFWRTNLGGDRSAVGRAIILDDRRFTIVGVLPPGFQYLRPYAVFAANGAFASDPILLDRGNHAGYFVVGRLKPGITAEAGGSDLHAIAVDLQREYPATNSGVDVHAELLWTRLVADVRIMLLVLLGAVGCLLLIMCANIAGLLVARGAARQHDLAVRAALGGGRLRLARQLLVESALMSAMGTALGVVLASGLLRLLIAVAPEGTPRLNEVRLDGAAVAFALAVSGICAVLVGVFPAFQASSITGQQIVARSRTSGVSVRTHRLRRALMVFEVALALVLLTGAGLMMRTLHELTLIDTGFRADHLLTMRASLTGNHWSVERRRGLLHELLPHLRSLPGVTGAALVSALPIDGSDWNSIFIAADKAVPSRTQLPSAAFTSVSDGFFSTMKTRVIRGRDFGDEDGVLAPRTVVINETLARRLWGGEDPIGKRIKQGWPEWPTPWREVVGVVADVKFEGIAETTPMQVYMPLAQETPSDYAMVMRTAGDPRALAPAVEATVHALNKGVPVYAVRTMEQVLESSLARRRLSMVVLVVFACVALVLASVGLYGVVAYGVTERAHEIGVRMALGADSRHVLALVVRQGLAPAMAGVAIGLAGALALSRTIEGLLFRVTPADPLTLAMVVLTLVGVALLACYVPARRAARVNPALALRGE